MPCSTRAKKGWLPAFSGYTRDQEERLCDFAKDELRQVLLYKREHRFFSDSLMHLADPEFKPDTPPPRKKSTKKASAAALPVPMPEVDASQASPPRKEGGEVPAPQSSPLQRPRPSPHRSPPSHSKNLQDFASFWQEEEEDG